MKIEGFDVAGFLARAVAPSLAPAISAAGAYGILLTNPDSLPTVVPGRDGLLYVGMTDQGLDARNHFQHAHSGFSTLRRSLGALLKEALKLKAIPRGPGSSKSNVRNYRFTDEGEQALTEWMNGHLLLTQVAVETDLTGFEEIGPGSTRNLARLPQSPLGKIIVRHDQINVTDPKRLRQLVERDDCRVASPALKAAEILLAEA